MQFLQLNFKILDDIEIMTHFQRFTSEYLPNQGVILTIKKWTTSYLNRGSYKEMFQKLMPESKKMFVLYYMVALLVALWIERKTGLWSQLVCKYFALRKGY